MAPAPPFRTFRLPLALALLAVTLVAGAPLAQEHSLRDREADLMQRLASRSRTGVIYDRVLPLARLDRLDGGPSAPVVGLSDWRQGYDELRRASLGDPGGPALPELDTGTASLRRQGIVPLAIFDRAFERLAAAAGDRAGLEAAAEAELLVSRAFAAAALTPRTYRGARVTFALDRSRYFADAHAAPRSIEIDFADGRGFRLVRLGERVEAGYATTGTRVLTARVTRADGSTAQSRFPFEVAGLASPSPDDTLAITASVAYQGQFGTGEAYVYLAPGRSQIENPVVVVEGFDLDNSMNWDELYALLNQENLIETLRADGFDAVVLNFTDATDAIQKNGLVVAELIGQVQGAIHPAADVAVVGASMGGLCSRYALAWMESNAVPHRVRTWLSFDAPHGGANIPLGLQYWINFFASQSAEAAAFLAILDRPAARQMLLYHYTTPPGATGQPDPMRAAMLADFAALGDYPAAPRRVAIANGSGNGANQGFAPAAQVILWDYSSLFLDLRGNVWALPNLASGTIFAGRIRIVFTTTTQNVIVSGTQPWDGAPGGSRSSFADVDAVAAPGGDIVALHPDHCFIPTVSALALATGDPFFDIAGAPDPLALTPFDALYYPNTNEEHVLITPASAAWIRNEIGQGNVSAPIAGDRTGGGALELALAPNPFTGSLALTFALAEAAPVELRIFGVDGREVRRVAAGIRSPGAHQLRWDGRDEAGSRVPAGIYFAKLTAGSKSVVRRVASVR